jgi:DNA-binding LacI/PurR family transcriptional regulator
MRKGLIKLSASQQLARQIQRQIESGILAVGSSLPSMRELAEQYRVSLTTVQKAIRELGDRDIIKVKSRQGGVVQPNTDAGPRKNQIGLIVGLDPQNRVPLWWHQQIIHAVQVVLAESGYRITIFNYWERRPEHSRQIIDAIAPVADQLAGVFSFLTEGIQDVMTKLDQHNLPWMTINPLDLRTQHNFVTADNLSAGRIMGRCFVRLGYERVAVVYDEMKRVSPLEKITGLYQGYLENDRSPAGIQLVHPTGLEEMEGGYEAMRQHLKHHPAPQAIFAIGDTLAIGAMRACQEAGLRIPEDVSVVGTTGMPRSLLHSEPALTTFRQPVEEMGRQLALCLLEMIRGGVRRISGRRIACPFIVRQSLPITEAVRQELDREAACEVESTAELFDPADEQVTADTSMLGVS